MNPNKNNAIHPYIKKLSASPYIAKRVLYIQSVKVNKYILNLGILLHKKLDNSVLAKNNTQNAKAVAIAAPCQ